MMSYSLNSFSLAALDHPLCVYCMAGFATAILSIYPMHINPVLLSDQSDNQKVDDLFVYLYMVTYRYAS